MLFFCGGQYHTTCNAAKNKSGLISYRCKFYSQTGKTSINAKTLFLSEVKMQLCEANSDLSMPSLTQLIAEQWSKLSVGAYRDYERRAIEINQKNDQRCAGRLYFKATNGQVETGSDGLDDYVQHRSLC